MVFILAFEDARALETQTVGSKFAALARAAREGFAVPEAAAIVIQAHAHFLATGGWPDGLREEVIAAARRLDIRQGVSIRSSAAREDLPGCSFAGQYRSFLNVDSEHEILGRIEECWKSAESEAVRSYLRAVNMPGTDTATPLMAVIIQRMVQSVAAGVAFSRDPLHADRGEIVIEAVKGHAEALVGGHRSPCRARVRRDGRVIVEDGSPSLGRLAAKTPWREIAGLLKRLEQSHGGRPLDIEWAVDRGQRLWLLQVRPITALASEEDLPPAGAWTRKIADDLWADRLEPFMTDVMLRHAPRFDLSRIARLAGITPLLPALTVIHGYLYINCDSIRRIIAHLPRPLRFNELVTLLPAGARLDDIPPPQVWTTARLLLRMILLPWKEPKMVPFICLHNAPRAIRRLNARLRSKAPEAAATASDLLERLKAHLETLGLIQENNQWPYFHATLLTWILRRLAAEPAHRKGAGFWDLLSRGADNVTIRIEHWFRHTARRIGSTPGLKERFLAEAPSRLARSLPTELQAEVHTFLKRYGCRSRHRTLLLKRWAEAPEEVIGILQSLVRHGQAGGNAPRAAGETAEEKFRAWVFRPALQPLAGLARRFLDLREELRFLLDEALFRIRLDLLALGRTFGIGEAVFFLKLPEIWEMVAGRLVPQEAANLAAQRQRRFLTPFNPGVFWVDGQPEYDFCAGGTVLRGIGTSPGRAMGRAVIVEDPAAVNIRRGDVVVARHTDPGWTPILSVVSGIVMEEGGLLNHCSIVARELGVPSIVGVGRATQLIPDGANVTIDGGTGMVRIEEA